MIKKFGIPNVRLSARVAAVIGGTALSLVSTMSMAVVIDSGPVNLAIPATLDGIYLNVVTGVSATVAPFPAGWDLNPYVTGGFLTFFSSAAVANTNQIVGSAAGASLLAPGAVIGPASTYAAAGVVTAPAFRVASTTSFVGFQFRNEVTSATNYGYAQLTTSAPNGAPAIITRYVYENAGTAITIAGGGGGGATVTPTTASGTASPLPSYNLPTGSSSRGFVFNTAGGNAVLTCGVTGAGFAVAPIPLNLVVGTPGTVTVTYTGATAGTFNSTLTCTTAGAAQTFTYPVSVVVGPAPVVAAPVIPVPTLSLMGSLMLLAGFLGLGMFMTNRRA